MVAEVRETHVDGVTHSISLLGRRLAAFAFIASLSFPSVALAQTPDEVQLVDGGMVRGTLIEVAPGRQVVLQVPGESTPRTIPWGQIRDVKPAPSSRPGPPLDDVDVGREGDVFLHVDTEASGVEVHRVQSTTMGIVGDQSIIAVQTKLECHAPCDRKLPSGQYFFSGPGITPSRGFSLDAGWERAEADVDAGSAGLNLGGWWMSSLGLAAATSGGIFIGLGYALDDDTVGTEHYAGWRTAGFVTLGVGSAMLVGGIVMIVESVTDFELHPETTTFAGIEIPTGRFAF